MELIHRELASANPAWHRVLNFILNSNQMNTNKDLGQTNDDGECCLTDHSGWWCRRRRRYYEGHLHPFGAVSLINWMSSLKHHVDAPSVFSILVNFRRNKYRQFLLSMLDLQNLSRNG